MFLKSLNYFYALVIVLIQEGRGANGTAGSQKYAYRSIMCDASECAVHLAMFSDSCRFC